MNCEQVKKLIPEWLNDELDAIQAQTIENHLFSCDSCRQEAAFWKAVGVAVRENTGDIKAPPGFTRAVMAQLPEQHNIGWQNFTARWKRGIAVAATFLLVSAGAVGGYFQWGINAAPRVVENNQSGQMINAAQEPGEIINEEPGPLNNPAEEEPGTQTGEDDPDNKGATQAGNNEQENQGTDNASSSQDTPPEGSDSGGNDYEDIIDPSELALMSTDKERVVERTFLQVKVDDFNSVYLQMLEYLNGVEAGYEVLASENTESGSQESLKIVVDNSRAEALLENLSTLGEVVATDNTKDSITAEYNENVEQVSLLKDQFEVCGDVNERKQLQVKITGIMGQLKTWDQEAKKKTIILLLEN